jgi:hypothetical protein
MKQFFSLLLLFVFVSSISFAQEFSVKVAENPVKAPEIPESVVFLQWDDGTNFNSVGLTGGGTFTVAARFPASVTGPYTGYNLTIMDIYINDVPSSCILKIFDQGTSTSPGTLLHSEDVTASVTFDSWNTFMLSSPVPITGNDIWVAYEVTHAAGEFPCGTDAGPAVVDGDWIETSPGTWQRLSVIAPTLNYNWNIHAGLEEGGGPGNTYFEDFEGFIAGQQLACQDPVNWSTWTNAPCGIDDALISTNYAFSGSNSVLIDYLGVGQRWVDLVKPFGGQTTGTWYVDFMAYIPAGKFGYYNILADFAGASSVWAFQAYFNGGGSGTIDAGAANAAIFSFPHDTWFPVQFMVNLDTDQAQFWVNSVSVYTWQYSLGTFGNGCPLVLDASDIFAPDGDIPSNNEMYIDDFRYSDEPIPVELTSFAASVNDYGQVLLNWETATEINNHMFEIERRTENSEFRTIGYVDGAGTTTEPRIYSYLDQTVESGNYTYRLKQIDFDGTYEHSYEVEVEVIGVLTFNLEQNYPNPFNPSTNIKYSVPESGNIKLSVYNLVGEEVAVLVDGVTQSGFYEVSFDASNLPSGVYLYKLQSANLVQTKKMMLLK